MSALDLQDLSRPLPAWNPKAWYYAAARGLLNSVGRLSEGISIGLEHGFDSGVMLDYVYENRAEGSGVLGRLIDRAYLSAPGWKGIRNRGALVEASIAGVVSDIAAERGKVAVADLACGGGRYVLDALATLRDVPIAATLRDYRTENVAKAAQNAALRGLAVRVERADAFSDSDLARLDQPDLVIVSGLHEIIPDDAVVENHFRQIAAILPKGGLLLVTVQPDHPQVEFIARVLKSHTGEPWAMRLRPLDLTRRWLEESGMVVERVKMEKMGIFGVIKARKA